MSLSAVRILVVCVGLAALAGCGGGGSLAPVQDRPTSAENKQGTHVVRPGETLYLIAWRQGFDPVRLAQANRLRAPYRVVPGQRLALRQAPLPRANLPKKPAATPEPAAPRKAPPAAPPAPAPASKGPLRFEWPTEGKVSGRFGAAGGKGINIAGKPGQPIRAVLGGEVVYVGNGLLGYGNLIIVKHEQNYLSAYAHNQAVFVKEGEAVPAGRKIANLGSSGTDRPRLHFELRRNGKPVDPEQYLKR